MFFFSAAVTLEGCVDDAPRKTRTYYHHDSEVSERVVFSKLLYAIQPEPALFLARQSALKHFYYKREGRESSQGDLLSKRREAECKRLEVI